MKVGTDGVLLGAWAEPTAFATMPAAASSAADRIRILDVGTGCGLVALMLAQRFPKAVITALEIDTEAACQATQNVQRSPYAAQIKVETADFLRFKNQSFDAIVSNPPFFEEDLLPPDTKRANARHTAAGLNFDALIAHSAELMCVGGSLQVIIPKTAQMRFHALANQHDLVLVRATDVRTVQRKSPKRVLLHFVKGSDQVPSPPSRNELVLMDSGNRSAAYSHLCREFYL